MTVLQPGALELVLGWLAEYAADDWWQAEMARLYCPDSDHDLEFVDNSFDHEYGAESIFFYRCTRCGSTQPYDGDDE